MHTKNSDVRTVHCAAHVQAAGHGDAQFGGQIFVREVIDESIHHALHQP